jgi:outer membrane protein OmpA-like peptidoglycan-associated protein
VRLYVGLYLTNQKLGNRATEDEAFRRLVAYGLAHKRLAVEFLFRPGSTIFINDQTGSQSYETWLQQTARESATRDVCLEITGHTTPSGPPPINNRLSLLRAEYVRDRLSAIDNESDALDRRVEFKVIEIGCAKAA